MGLVNQVVPKAELETFTREYALTIAQNAPLTVRSAKATVEQLVRPAAARKLHRDNLVVVHLPEGAFAVSKKDGELWVPSRPVKSVVSSVGAGDAFAAGMLYGLHEEWPLPQCMDLAHAAAGACLGHETTTGGLRPINEL